MCLGPEIIAAIQIAGVVATAGGAYMSYEGMQDQASASKAAEKNRQKQMALENAQRQRQILAQARRNQAQALQASVIGNSMFGSGLAGAQSQYRVQSDVAQNEEGRSFEYGSNIFAANARLAEAQGLTSMGGAFMNMGTTLVNSAEKIERVGRTVATGKSSA